MEGGRCCQTSPLPSSLLFLSHVRLSNSHPCSWAIGHIPAAPVCSWVECLGDPLKLPVPQVDLRPQRGHNTLEVRPWLRPWEPQGHRPSVRWSIYTALGWAVSPKSLPESERPGGKGWRRTSRDPAAPDADENGPRKAKSLGAGRPAGAGPLPLALLSAPSSGRLFSLVNLTSQPRADWLHSSSSKVLWPQARLP